MNLIYRAKYHPLVTQPINTEEPIVNIFKHNLLGMSVCSAMNMSMAEGGGGSEMTLLDLDSNPEDVDFDSIEKAAGFSNPPDGTYIIHLDSAKIEKRKPKDKPEAPEKVSIAFYYSVSTTQEMSKAGEQEPAPGTKFSERFSYNEKGLGYFKLRAEEILGTTGKGLKLGAVLAELNLCDAYLVAKLKNKETKGKNDDGTPNGEVYQNLNINVVKIVPKPIFK